MEEALQNTYHADLKSIQHCIGKSVKAMARDRYYFNGESDDEDQGSLEITFSDDSKLKLYIADDGESVKADNKKLTIPESFDVEESARCSWRRLELLKNQPWQNIENSTLISAKAIIDQYKISNTSYISGWIIHFSSNNFLSYYNCGDNAQILLNELPPTTTDEINTNYEMIGMIND